MIAYNDSTNFKWSYTANNAGPEYSKIVTVGIKNNFLSFFMDNWDLYPVGNTEVNLSKEAAVSIALNTAQRHSWTVPVDSSSLTAEKLLEKRVRDTVPYILLTQFMQTLHGAKMLLKFIQRGQ